MTTNARILYILERINWPSISGLLGGGTPGVYRGPGKEARLCYEGHVLMDNRQGLVVDVKITEATGTSERDAALDMLQMVPSSGRITVGADRGTTRGTSYGTAGTCTSHRTWLRDDTRR